MTAEADSTLVTLFCPSPNFEPRKGGLKPDLLLLHYTGMESAEAALHWLTTPESKVSCHYLVDEEGRITQMVKEDMRAWHAGLSHWAGEDDINSCSIGIEIHNPGHELGYPNFPESQMIAVEALCGDIVERRKIVPERVLAHSDVAPGRKADPGEKFNWERLAGIGVGLWIEPVPAGDDAGLEAGDESEGVAGFQSQLKQFGYGVEVTGLFDERTEKVTAAFQQHWRQEKVDGRADASTLATLENLLGLVSLTA